MTKRQLSDETNEFDQAIQKLNSKSEAIANKMLEKCTTNEIDTTDKDLTKAILMLKNLMPESKSKSFTKKITQLIPFANKIKEDVNKTIIENQNAKETIKELVNALDTSAKAMREDEATLNELLNALDDSIDLSNKLSENIVAKIQKLQEDTDKNKENRFELNTLKNLLATLESITMVNNQTANQIDANLRSVEAMSSKVSKIKPLLSGMFTVQSAVAKTNAKTQRLQTMSSVITESLNNMITSVQEESHKSLKNTIIMSQEQVIKESTVKTLGQNAVSNGKELQKVIVDLQKEQQKYLVTMQEAQKQIKGNQLKQLAFDELDHTDH